VLGLPLPDWGIVLAMFASIFMMGAFIDRIGILMIAVPLFTPIAAALGLNPLWFGMMVVVVMQTSFLTPPFAYAIFYLKGIAPPEVETRHIYRGMVPFILLQEGVTRNLARRCPAETDDTGLVFACRRSLC